VTRASGDKGRGDRGDRGDRARGDRGDRGGPRRRSEPSQVVVAPSAVPLCGTGDRSQVPSKAGYCPARW
jgi:hypothetical protein